MKRQISA